MWSVKDREAIQSLSAGSQQGMRTATWSKFSECSGHHQRPQKTPEIHLSYCMCRYSVPLRSVWGIIIYLWEKKNAFLEEKL